jgi:hypothetical protein
MSTYGYEFESEDDPKRAMVERAVRMTNEGGAPGATLVDIIPFCEHCYLHASWSKSLDESFEQ